MTWKMSRSFGFMLAVCRLTVKSAVRFSLACEDVPLVEFMCLVFTRMPGESYRRRLGSLLLYLCYVFWALINSHVCWYWLVRFGRCPDDTPPCGRSQLLGVKRTPLSFVVSAGDLFFFSLAQDDAIVNVVPLRGIRIYAPLSRLQTGTRVRYCVQICTEFLYVTVRNSVLNSCLTKFVVGV